MKRMIRGAQVLQSSNHQAESLDIIIEDDKIAAIGSNLDPIHHGVEQIESGENKLITPGLVNAHLHSHDRFDKGRFGTLPLEIWISLYNPPTISRQWTPRECYLRTLLSGIELLRSGTTMVIDDVHHGVPLSHENIEAVFQAYDDLGIRAQISISHCDKPFWDGVPFLDKVLPDELKQRKDNFVFPSNDEVLEYWDSMANSWKDRVQFVLSPSGPQRCSDQFLQDTWSLSEKYDLPVIIHVLETEIQQMSGDFYFNKSLVQHMKDLELLTPKSNLVHGVWMTSSDLKLVADNDACIVHCPTSNLKLGSGIAPVEEMLKLGITVGLGTDNHNANDGANMLETIKMAGLLPAVKGNEYEAWPTSQDVLKMATQGGAACAGLQDDIGSLEVGKQADYVVFDLNHSAFFPLNDAVNQVVFASQSSAITEVVVAGKSIMSDGVARQIDEAQILEELKENVGIFQEKIANVIPVGKAIEPYLKEAYAQCKQHIREKKH